MHGSCNCLKWGQENKRVRRGRGIGKKGGMGGSEKRGKRASGELSMITVHCNKYVYVRNKTGNLKSQLFHRLSQARKEGQMHSGQ